jgi:hypothetical protein
MEKRSAGYVHITYVTVVLRRVLSVFFIILLGLTGIFQHSILLIRLDNEAMMKRSQFASKNSAGKRVSRKIPTRIVFVIRSRHCFLTLWFSLTGRQRNVLLYATDLRS